MATNKKIQNLIRTFVKNISADKTQPKNTNTMYGTVVTRGGTKQVRLDGSTEPTACIFNVEADEGDRVVCSVQNHSWSVDSNVTKPASSPTTVKGRSDVESIIDEHVISLSGIDVYYQVDEPTVPSGGFKDGDTWYELDANGYASKLHVWKNNEWVDTMFDGGNILRANSVTANEIASNTITANEINLTDVFAQNITATGTITGVTLNGALIKSESDGIKTSLDSNGLYFYGKNEKVIGYIRGTAYSSPTWPLSGYLWIGGNSIHIDCPISLSDELNTSSYILASGSIETSDKFMSTRSDIGFTHIHRTSDTKISFGVGSGGTNRGIYDDAEKGWMMRRGSGTEIFFGGGLRPGTTAKYSLGDVDHIWSNLYTEAMRLYRNTSNYFQFGGTPTATRTITFQNASGTVAFTSSDIRLKENIEDSDVCALDVINKMQVRKFDWKDIDDAGYNKGTHQNIGFIADELEKLDPRFIVDGSGGFNDDDSINPKCIDTFYLTVHLAKGIQELNDEVQKLKKTLQEV